MSPNQIGDVIVNAALRVHTVLGPGLLESAFEACLAHEISKSGCWWSAKSRSRSDTMGDLDVGYRLDLRVDGQVIVELKAIEKLLPIHSAQLLSYLKLTGSKLGYLLNFNVVHMKEGIRRVVNKL